MALEENVQSRSALWGFLARSFGLDRVRCRACSRPADPATGLCEACALAMPSAGPHRCSACGLPLPENAPEGAHCGACAAAPPPWTRLDFHGPHKGLLRDLILAWKFGGRLGLTGLLGDLAARSLSAPPGAHDLLVPVPLHPSRLVARGYNQSLELARRLAPATGARLCARGLTRTRATQVQSLMRSARERRENIRGAFAADAATVRGMRIILADDVLTTGATLEECARTLLKAGAARVDVVVVARAVSSQIFKKTWLAKKKRNSA